MDLKSWTAADQLQPRLLVGRAVSCLEARIYIELCSIYRELCSIYVELCSIYIDYFVLSLASKPKRWAGRQVARPREDAIMDA